MSLSEESLHASADAEDDFRDPDSLPAETENTSASDPFALYLRQIGAIPMLNRSQERELTGRLDRLRQRYRRAALWSAAVLDRVVDTFERIQAGELPLDRTIDEVPSLGLTVEQIRERLPRQLRKLRGLLEEAREEFQQRLCARSNAERLRWRQAHRSLLRRAIAVAETLSPRIELLDANRPPTPPM